MRAYYGAAGARGIQVLCQLCAHAWRRGQPPPPEVGHLERQLAALGAQSLSPTEAHHWLAAAATREARAPLLSALSGALNHSETDGPVATFQVRQQHPILAPGVPGWDPNK